MCNAFKRTEERTDHSTPPVRFFGRLGYHQLSVHHTTTHQRMARPRTGSSRYPLAGHFGLHRHRSRG